jgi:hypothetical protein
MKKAVDFKKLVLGSAGKKRVRKGNWALENNAKPKVRVIKSCPKCKSRVETKWFPNERERRCKRCGHLYKYF